jgi:hypothetical protein
MIGSDYLELPATWDRGQRSRWVRTGQISTLPRPWVVAGAAGTRVECQRVQGG